MTRLIAFGTVLLCLVVAFPSLAQGEQSTADLGSPPEATAFDYLLLATKKTSTLEKELAEAAEAGYHLAYTMGGETAFGGDEIVAVMARAEGAEPHALFEYRLLATNKTSTMQKEMREAAEAGYVHRAQSVATTSFGGREVIVIMERELDTEPRPRAEYLLLATKKTSTMQKELREAGQAGFSIVGMTVAKTAFGGAETVAILERAIQ